MLIREKLVGGILEGGGVEVRDLIFKYFMSEDLRRRNEGEANFMDTIKPYSFEVKDFSPECATKALENYTVGDKITRENFTNFLIRSFAVSRGVPLVQYGFFEWVEKATGFSTRDTLKRLAFSPPGEIRSNPWDFLSNEEQKKFLQAFLSVNIHEDALYSESDDEITTEKHVHSIKAEFRNIVNFYVNVDELSPNQEFIKSLRETSSWDDFKKIAIPYIKEANASSHYRD